MPNDPREHPLAICFTLLQGLGEAGELVWKLGVKYVERKKEPLSQEERLAYLRNAIKHLRQRAKDPAGTWRRLPVDFRTFVESPELLNKMQVLWPKVIEAGEELNSGKYTECVLTGAIGVAKTTLALYTQAYQIYVLSCYAAPHDLFDLDPSTEILTVFQSLSKDLSKDVDYKRFRDMISNGPYFENHFPFQKDRESDMRFPRNIIVKPVNGTDQAAIGQNVIGGIMDEINFMAVIENSKQKRDGGVYDTAKENYNSIAVRRNSRFNVRGLVPGMLCLVSSRNYPGQFTDEKEKEAETNKRIYVYDKKLWEIRPDKFCFYRGVRSEAIIDLHGPDCPFWFKIFVGDATRKPRILEPNEERKFSDVDQKLIMDVPIENLVSFRDGDILKALRDIAGVSTQALFPFIPDTDKVAACFGKTFSIIDQQTCDFSETKLLLFPNRAQDRTRPRFAHIDPGITKDSAGVAIGHCPGFKLVRRGDVSEILPVIRFDLLLEVKPPKGGEILFENIRRLLYKVRSSGLDLKWVTMDTMQSRDMLQTLSMQNFVVGVQSMDETTDAYDITKQAIYDGRVECPVHAKAQAELSRLEYNSKDDVVDHPPNFSKDVADAIAGVVFGLTMRRETWTKHGVSMRQVPESIKVATPRGKQSVNHVETLRNEKSRKDARARDWEVVK